MKTNKNQLSLVQQAFEHAYSEICDFEQRIVALHYAMKPIRERSYNEDIYELFGFYRFLSR
mgnify:CR=1 FL=1